MRGWGTVFLCLFLASVVLASPVRATSEENDRQGWSAEDRAWWYSVSQGSHLLPWPWMQALERSNTTQKFLAPAHMSELGYLPNPYTTDGLPIGFVIDQPEPSTFVRKICRFLGLNCGLGGQTSWLGLNCAACHTGQMSYGGQTIRVDGAPTLADFQTFEARLLQALKETRQTPEKWARFTEALGIAKGDLEALDKLGRELDAQIDWYDRLEKKNYAPVRYGPGRLDAQGHILNKVSLKVGVTDQLSDFPSDAPASYPFIWNVPQQDFIQWNGIVQNQAHPITIRGEPTDFGAVGRNVGEVLGVFGELDVSPALTGYISSVRVDNLILIERQLKRLQSPRWPDAFGALDEGLKTKGAALYKDKCEGCHSVVAFDDLTTKIKAVMQPITVTDPDKQQTDIWLACNTFLHRSKSGLLEGRKLNIYTGETIQAVDSTAKLLENAVTGTIVGRGDEVVERFIKDTFRDDRIFGDLEFPRAAPPTPMEILPGITDEAKRARAKSCLTARDDFLRYKSRPLNGIWATAPYLHNGSVPTLYDMLLPSRMRQTARIGSLEPVISSPVRPDSFRIGTHEFDPKKVGYMSDGPFEFRTHEGGAPVLGNYNSGHDYGNAALTDDDRWALVEYLKSL